MSENWQPNRGCFTCHFDDCQVGHGSRWSYRNSSHFSLRKYSVCNLIGLTTMQKKHEWMNRTGNWPNDFTLRLWPIKLLLLCTISNACFIYNFFQIGWQFNGTICKRNRNCEGNKIRCPGKYYSFTKTKKRRIYEIGVNIRLLFTK